MNPPILPFWSICRLSLAKVEKVGKASAKTCGEWKEEWI